jgi:prepilin-type N-terminal cleavage/methylation domain-containing protein
MNYPASPPQSPRFQEARDFTHSPLPYHAMQTRVHTNGLTLPELLVTILLVAILVSLFAPSPCGGGPQRIT